MTLLEILTIFLYGGALISVIYYVFGIFHKPSAQTIIVYDQPPIQQESSIWPWYGGYNWYNTWSPWSYTGSGYYGGRYRSDRRHWGSGGSRPWGQGGRGAHGGMSDGRGRFGAGAGGRGGSMGGRSGGGGGRR